MRTGSTSNTTLSYKVNSSNATYVLNLTSNEKKKIAEVRANKVLKVNLPGQLVWQKWFIVGKEWVIKGRMRPKSAEMPVGKYIAHTAPHPQPTLMADITSQSQSPSTPAQEVLLNEQSEEPTQIIESWLSVWNFITMLDTVL